MQCPHCGDIHHKVIDTRDTADAIRRRRQCEMCGLRFTTYEHVSANLLVVKSDGRREPFDRQKMLQGIQIAATKRPVSRKAMESIVDQVQETALNTGKNEVSSAVLGKMVLDTLAQMDQVTYIRFASVYLDIHDLAELRTEIDRLMGRDGAA